MAWYPIAAQLKLMCRGTERTTHRLAKVELYAMDLHTRGLRADLFGPVDIHVQSPPTCLAGVFQEILDGGGDSGPSQVLTVAYAIV